MSTLVSSSTEEVKEIKVGYLVGLKKSHTDPKTQEQLWRWIKAYQDGPFLVSAMESPEHVSLAPLVKVLNGERVWGEVIHFGSTCDPSLHISFVERWKV